MLSKYENFILLTVENVIEKLTAATILFKQNPANSASYFLTIISQEELAKLILLPFAYELDYLEELMSNRQSELFSHKVKQKMFTSYTHHSRDYSAMENNKQDSLYVNYKKNKNNLKKFYKSETIKEMKEAIICYLHQINILADAQTLPMFDEKLISKKLMQIIISNISIMYIKKARELNPESTYADTFTEYSNEYFLKINMEFYSRNMSAAEKLISAKEYSDAFRVLLLLEKKFPDDKKANNLMALCRKRISAKRRAVDNKMKERYLKIGDEYYNKSDFIKAIKNYLTALIYGPHDEQIKKKLESARVKSDMKKKRVLNPKAVKAHFQKGMKYYSMGQYKKAIFEWKKVLELDPQHVMARKNIERASELIK